MKRTTPTRCGKCGGSTPPFTMFVNASTGATHALCVNCMGNEAAGNMEDLAEIDGRIEEYEEMLKNMEEMIKDAEVDESGVPEGLRAFAFTPMQMYRSLQVSLASLKTRRLELLKTDESEESLQYELDKKVAEEKYEEASSIKKRLTALKNRPKRRKKARKRRSKPISELFSNPNDDIGKCVRCRERFPKASGLFRKYNLGDCHNMCLPCCVEEVPKHVSSVRMADEMIEEMGQFSKMLNGLQMFGKLMSDDVTEEDIEHYEKMKSGATVPTNLTNARMVAALEARKSVLQNGTQEEKAIGGAKHFMNLLRLIGEEDKEMLKEVMGEVVEIFGGENSEKGSNPEKSDAQKKADRLEKRKKIKEARLPFISKAIEWMKQDEHSKKCTECNKYPAKHPTIFQDFDLGHLHDLCFICSMQLLPIHVRKLSDVKAMIWEMECISYVLDELTVSNKLIQEGRREEVKNLDILEMEVKVEMPEQALARKALEALEMRKRFLDGMGEDSELIDLADNFIRDLR